MGQNIDTPKKEPKCKMIIILDDLTNEQNGRVSSVLDVCHKKNDGKN